MAISVAAVIGWYVLMWFVILWVMDDTYTSQSASDFLMIWILSPIVFPMVGLTFVVSCASDAIAARIKRRTNA